MSISATLIRRAFTVSALCVAATTHSVTSAATPVSLSQFYVHYAIPGLRNSFGIAPPTGFPPEVGYVDGSPAAPIVSSSGTFSSIGSVFHVRISSNGLSVPGVLMSVRVIGGANQGACSQIGWVIPTKVVANTQVVVGTNEGSPSLSRNGECSFYAPFFTGADGQFNFRDVLIFPPPVRRKAMDGFEYEAAPMVVEREGLPWGNYFAGYRLGFVAGESKWNLGPAPLPAAFLPGYAGFPSSKQDFELKKLPPPFVEGEAVEYFNRKSFPAANRHAHFYYAVDRTEQQKYDATDDFVRTGQSFKTGGYLPVCRFFSSVTPGQSTYFYSASEQDCTLLKTVPWFTDQGTAFRASLPRIVDGAPACPAATVPLYRLFFNGATLRVDSNHRYLTDLSIVQEMGTLLGWTNEGVKMCVPQ